MYPLNFPNDIQKVFAKFGLNQYLNVASIQQGRYPAIRENWENDANKFSAEKIREFVKK
jgi:hypothetical protein